MSSDETNADALHMQGVSAIRERRFGDAIELIGQAIALSPRVAAYHNNLGNAQRDAGKLADAEKSFRRAIEIAPHHAKAHYNLAKTQRDLDRIDEAIRLYQRAIELDPNYAKAHYSLGLLHLLRGEFLAGWAGYEWRWQRTDFKSPRREFVQPAWNGSQLPAKTILLWAEQGMGDMIQFARYVPLVAQRVANVVIECHPPLVELLKTVPGVREVFPLGQATSFDVQLPMLSLPRIFQTTLSTIPREVPYVSADPARVAHWNVRMRDVARRKIGVVWAGSALHREDRNRSIPPELFAPLSKAANVQLVSLQKFSRPTIPMLDYTDELHDFADSAALMMNLDLVITVDTAPAHLAGALGRAVWTLLPFAPDWRWMLERTDSPWYPTMRLFRQPARGDWVSVIDQVVSALQEAMP